MAKMTEEELKALVDSEMRQAQGYFSGTLAQARQKALIYYLGEAKGDLAPPEIEGRSSVVDTTVRNQIQWMLPSIMKTFCSGEDVVEFSPSKDLPGEDEKAEQASAYVNHVFFKQNDGYSVLETSITDALLQKCGIVKVWWDNTVEESREEYKALDQMELALLLQDDEVEPIEQKAYPDEDDAEQRQQAIQQLTQQAQQASQNPNDPQSQQAVQAISAQIQQIQSQPPKMLYDVTFKRTKEGGKCVVESVPPEEFLISRKAKSIKDTPFVAHRVMRTASDLVASGYKNVDQISSDDNGAAYSAERIERVQYDDELSPYMNSSETSDESMRVIWVTEAYLKADYDGDGIAEWRKVVKAGNTILENEECDEPPFAVLRPIILPHRFFGMSIADLAMEPQRVQTYLLRAMLDNLFLSVNKRHWIVEGQVNLDDFLTSRPGGAVRVKSPGMVGEMGDGGGAGSDAMSMLEWMQDFTENSTGWTRRSQGVGASGMQQQTATGMNIITNRDDMRLDLIIRNLANGIKDIFRLILKNVAQYQDKDDQIRVSGSWVAVDPREWKNGFDLDINVGLGTNNKEQQAQHLMGLMQVQREGIQIGIATPENIYEAANDYAKAVIGNASGKYFTDPKTQPPAPPQPNPDVQKFQAQQQLEQSKIQAQMQFEQQKQQAELAMRSQELQQEATIREHELQLESQKQTLQAQAEAAVAQHKAEMDAQLEAQRLQYEDRWKLIDAEVRLATAQIAASKATDGETTATADSSAMALQAILEKLNQPKMIIRGPDGRASGIV